MDKHSEKDKKYHAEIAEVYDYITNEPRHYANELLFRPIDRRLKPANDLLDLGCGTGQMFLRYAHLAQNIIAVDHSAEMLAVAARKAKAAELGNVSFVNQDLGEFLDMNRQLQVDLVTCVGVLHHLNQETLAEVLTKIHSILTPRGQLVLAEPIFAQKTPAIVQKRNARSILVPRLAGFMPTGTIDPDEAPLEEADLRKAIQRAGFSCTQQSKGFELFQVTEPLKLSEKILIRLIYAIYRKRGDVIALLLAKKGLRNEP